jgi:DNA-binding GntR family transcriptional regulator
LADNAADARHLYEQVAAVLRGAIMRGELEPGKSIPSEAELKAQHGVSRDTVRKALGILTQEGLITAGQGRVRYVRAYAPLRWTLSSFEGKDRSILRTRLMLGVPRSLVRDDNQPRRLRSALWCPRNKWLIG